MKKQTFKYRKLMALPLCGLLCLSVCLSGQRSLPSYTGIAETVEEGDASVQTVQEQINAASAGAEIKLEAPCSEALSVAAGKEITLDLNGYEVSATITNSGTLTVKDGEGGGSISVTSANAGTISGITNSGTLTVDGAAIYSTGTGSEVIADGIINKSGGVVYFKDGLITATSTSTKWGFGIDNESGGVIAEISGGTITSHIANSSSGSNAVGINNGGTITKISGGEINAVMDGNGYAVAIRNRSAKINEISGGKISAETKGTNYAAAIFNENGNNEIGAITGGTLYAYSNGTTYATAILNTSGTIASISGGTLYALVDNPANDAAYAFGLYNNGGTVTEISGGVIQGVTTAKQWAFGIWNVGTIGTVSGGAIIAMIKHNTPDSAPNAIAISNDKTINSITGGTFYAYSAHASGSTIGIRTRYAGSSVGSISGGAVYISKTNDAHYFYTDSDGTSSYASGYELSSASAETAYRYVIPTNGSYDEKYLSDEDDAMTGIVYNQSMNELNRYILIGTERKDAVKIGDAQYASVNAAVTASAKGDVVAVLKDLEEDVVIPAGKEVTLDLNGHKLTGSVTVEAASGEEEAGSLTLTDSAGTGLLYKSTSASGLDPLISNYGTLVYENVTARIDGLGDGPEADGIYNYAGASLTVKGGTLRAVSYGTKWSHAIVNAGTVEEFTGASFYSLSFSTSTASNIVALSNIGSGVVKSIGGGTLYASSLGNGTAVAIRLQGTSKVENITGGTVKAVVSGGTAKAYGIYLQESGTSATVSGGSISVVTYNDYAFGVWNLGSLNVAGGSISAYALHDKEGTSPNLIGISNEANASLEVSGGYIKAYSSTTNGGTYAVRNRGTLAVSGGAFDINKTACDYIYTVDAGSTTYSDGAQLVSMSSSVKYASKEGDVIVEQLDGDTLVGFDVYGAEGEERYGYHAYGKDGYYLAGFYAEGEDAEMIKPEDFENLESSTTVYADYEKAPLYYFLGSSVTYGHTTNGVSFVNEIENTLNCVTVKEAVSGTTLANGSSNSYVARMLANFDKNAKVEHLIVQLSTNDATQGKTVGEVAATKNIEDFDDTTTVGAIEFIIAYAKMTWNCDVTFYTNHYYNNATYETLIEKLYEVQEKWGIGIVDFYQYKYYLPQDETEHAIARLDDATLASYKSDAIHPNNAGYHWMGQVFSEYLAAYFETSHDGAKIV